MKTDNQKDELHEKLSFLGRIKVKLFGKTDSETKATNQRDVHLEPKYWPEVKDFMDNLDNIIENHTIDDNNIKRINQRIVMYIEEQINKKGQVEDINLRYIGLNTLADRILSNNLSKLVGLKEDATSTADFSDAVNEFKIKLSHKKENEIGQDDSVV